MRRDGKIMSAFRFVGIALGLIGLVWTGTAAPSSHVSQPDGMLIQRLQRDIEPAEPESLRFVGRAALSRRLEADDTIVWLIALQKKGGEYCVFYEAKSDSSKFEELDFYLNCVIERAVFDDFNQDGFTDALYVLKIPSNRYDAYVREELLFLSADDAPRFCKSIRTPEFNADPKNLKCN